MEMSLDQRLQIDVELSYRLREPCPLLLQIEPANTHGQKVLKSNLNFRQGRKMSRVAAEDEIGHRTWVFVDQMFEIGCRFDVVIIRKAPVWEALSQTPLNDLPAPVVKYLLASRYCPLQDIDELITDLGADGPVGEFIQAASNWVRYALTYRPGSSDGNTTSQDAMRNRCGVCRDYAHVMIALCRAAMIPARYVSLYSPDVAPMDFHAAVQVYLDQQWHFIDPTGMASPERSAIIGVGRDANDVAFLTSFAEAEFIHQLVGVEVHP